MPVLYFPRALIHLIAAILVSIAIILFAIFATVRAAPTAPTFSVNSTGDAHAAPPLNDGICRTAPNNNVCTLRAAIEKADYWSGGGVTINFAGVSAPATYTLSMGQLVISNTMTINGAGATKTVIDGNGDVTHQRVIYIITHTVSISGVTITNGKETYTNQDPNAFAGGILHNDALTLTNSIVSHNSAIASSGAAYGGGIYSSGRLTLINTTVSDNSATGGAIASGGGIVSGLGTTLINSTVSGNTADDSGGGIYGGGTLIASTVSTNTASSGGGIYGGNLLLINSTVSGNNANISGGGIYHSGSTANLYNATIANNLANADSSGSGFGGGIANASGTVNFQNTIIGGNGHVVVKNSRPEYDPEDCSGTVTSLGYDIVSDTTDCTINGSYTLTSPNLGPLQNNGGPTLTQALLNGSPAIDTGQTGNCTDNLAAPILTDQRGYPRPVDGDSNGSAICDIGAYEYGSKLPTPTPTRTPTPTASATPCPGKPAAPTLLKPKNDKGVSKTRVLLEWSVEPCATRYKVFVKVGSPKGTKVDGATEPSSVSQYKTLPLHAGTFYWSVKACNGSLCKRSVWFAFKRT